MTPAIIIIAIFIVYTIICVIVGWNYGPFYAPEEAIQEILSNGGYDGLHTLMLHGFDTRALAVSHPGVYADLYSFRLIPLSRYTKEVIWNIL